MKHPIVGQEELQTLLVREIIRGQMPHAILFNGSIGYGALALAVNYARNLLCPNAHDNAGEYCGACPSCKSTDTERLLSACACHTGSGSSDGSSSSCSGGGCAGCSGGHCSTCCGH